MYLRVHACWCEEQATPLAKGAVVVLLTYFSWPPVLHPSDDVGEGWQLNAGMRRVLSSDDSTS